MQIFPGPCQTLEGLCWCHPSCSYSHVGLVRMLPVSETSSPFSFWNQGLVSWKTVFPQTWVGRDGLGMLQAHCFYYTAAHMTGVRVKAVMHVMGSSSKYRNSFALTPTPIAYLLLCSPCPIPNSPEPVLVCGQGFPDPWAKQRYFSLTLRHERQDSWKWVIIYTLSYRQYHFSD